MEYSHALRDPQVIAPHATWRGSYDRGTPITGQCLVYSSNGKMLAPPPDSTPSSGDQYGGVVGGGTYGGTAQHCIEVDWPSAYTWSARQYRRGYAGPSSWMGSLIFESRDASGLYYRRNRYYDSETGRFTQEDPIGLAGGVNVYGFANGDPISYSDPYGLRVCFKGSQRQVNTLKEETQKATGTTFALDGENCVVRGSVRSDGTAGMGEIRGTFEGFVRSELRYDVRFARPSDNQVHSAFGRYKDGSGYVAVIVPGDTQLRYDSPRDNLFGCLFPVQTTRWTLSALIAHELIGHGWLTPGLRDGASQRTAIRFENQYHAAHGEARRCY